ncbi:hypothetical protein N431DRAFT_529740 [Stipitochalara longipes BDJ]|nr:hypothetical protein N431DRAFT_529740 [Stipitochalara longipes BDJ]
MISTPSTCSHSTELNRPAPRKPSFPSVCTLPRCISFASPLPAPKRQKKQSRPLNLTHEASSSPQSMIAPAVKHAAEVKTCLRACPFACWTTMLHTACSGGDLCESTSS